MLLQALLLQVLLLLPLPTTTAFGKAFGRRQGFAQPIRDAADPRAQQRHTSRTVVVTMAFEPTSAAIARMQLAQRQLERAGHTYAVALLHDTAGLAYRPGSVRVLKWHRLLRAVLGDEAVQLIGPDEIQRVLPRFFDGTLPVMRRVVNRNSAFNHQWEKWQWHAADIYPLVWWRMYGLRTYEFMWSIEADVGWTGDLADILHDLSEQRGRTDFLGISCQRAGPLPLHIQLGHVHDRREFRGKAWDHWSERVSAASRDISDTGRMSWAHRSKRSMYNFDKRPFDEFAVRTGIHSCQPAVSRVSSRLLGEAYAFHVSGTQYAFCEMVLPTLAASKGWVYRSLERVRPKRFGTFAWDAKVDAREWDRITALPVLPGEGKLYHRLKF